MNEEQIALVIGNLEDAMIASSRVAQGVQERIDAALDDSFDLEEEDLDALEQEEFEEEEFEEEGLDEMKHYENALKIAAEKTKKILIQKLKEWLTS